MNWILFLKLKLSWFENILRLQFLNTNFVNYSNLIFVELFRWSLEFIWFCYCTRIPHWYRHGAAECKYFPPYSNTMSSFQNYFADPWNTFDFVIVFGSIIDITYSELNVSLSIFSFFLDLILSQKKALWKKHITYNL